VSFRRRLRALESRFRALAERDRDVYLPNLMPTGPVDYVLIAMEPSLGRWARSPTDASVKIAAGFRNFMWSLEDFPPPERAEVVKRNETVDLGNL
jgi:hypothetical protein